MIRHKAASPRPAARGQFSRIHQVAPMCTPYIESKVVAMATSLRCRVSAISAFCWPTTQTPLHNQLPSRYLSVTRVVTPHGRPQSVPTLYNGTPLSPPSKLPLPMGGSGPPSNTWFLGLTRDLNPNGIWIDAAVFAGLTSVSVTERQTDRQTMLLAR